MATATLPALPSLPEPTLELVTLIKCHNTRQRTVNRIFRNGGSLAESSPEWQALKAARAAYNAYRNTVDGVAYRDAVNAYNAAVDARNAWRKNETQARVNSRAAAAVRSAACPSCSATHAGGC